MFPIIVVACLVVHACVTQPPQNRHINDFNFATWNAHGAQWTHVLNIMADNNLDVLAVQEAGDHLPADGGSRKNASGGSIRDYETTGISIPPTYYIRREPTGTDSSHYILEFQWVTSKGIFYLYYTDRRRHESMKARTHPGDRLRTSLMNMAIITREPVQSTFYMIPVDNRGNEIGPNNRRRFINRPVIGVQIENTVFFNLHAQPNDNCNEVPGVINVISNYMIGAYSTLTWTVMGGFNRLPDSFQLPQPPDHHLEVISQAEPTRIALAGRSRVLDYGVFGGPQSYQFNIHAALLLPFFQQSNYPSDHTPVQFRQ